MSHPAPGARGDGLVRASSGLAPQRPWGRAELQRGNKLDLLALLRSAASLSAGERFILPEQKSKGSTPSRKEDARACSQHQLLGDGSKAGAGAWRPLDLGTAAAPRLGSRSRKGELLHGSGGAGGRQGCDPQHWVSAEGQEEGGCMQGCLALGEGVQPVLGSGTPGRRHQGAFVPGRGVVTGRAAHTGVHSLSWWEGQSREKPLPWGVPEHRGEA